MWNCAVYFALPYLVINYMCLWPLWYLIYSLQYNCMGNNSNYRNFQWDHHFTILERSFNDHTLILEKKNGTQEYIGRELLLTDKKQSQATKKLIKQKYHNPSPFLTKLEEVYCNEEAAYCSPEELIYLVFEKPKQTLRQEILARKFANQPFTEEEADIILESGVKAIRALKELNHPHNNVCTSSIFIDEDRRILLGDPWVTPPANSFGINQNAYACPSPEKILLQNDQIMSICPFRSDLFSLGTVVLEALNYEHMDILYEKGFRKLLQSRVSEKLSKIENEQLRYKLSIVLSHNSLNRDQIYQFYRSTANQEPARPMQSPKKQQNAEKQGGFNKGTPIAKLNGAVGSYRNAKKLIYEQKTNGDVDRPKPQVEINGQVKVENKGKLGSNNVNNSNGNQYHLLGFGNQTVPMSQNNQIVGYGSHHSGHGDQRNFGVNNYYGIGLGQYRTNALNSHSSTTPTVTFVKPTMNATSTTHTSTFTTATASPTTIPALSTGYQPSRIHQPSLVPSNIYTPPTPLFQQSPTPITTAQPPSISQPTLQPTPTPVHLPVVASASHSQESSVMSVMSVMRSAQDFVKTSANIRYVEDSGVQLSTENVDTSNIVHAGNYALKTNPNNILNLQQTQSHMTTYSNPKQLATPPSEIQSYPTPNTPTRKPQHRYNSTIKQQAQQNSYSGSKNGQDEYQYVIETYDAGRYEGQKKYGVRNGNGKFYYCDGTLYDGVWRDGLMHGYGTLINPHGFVTYQGSFHMDQLHGTGKINNPNPTLLSNPYNYNNMADLNLYWNTYEGDLVADQRHGRGKVTLSNGEIFIGGFVEDRVEGNGKFYAKDGKIVEGVWKANCLLNQF